MRSKCAWPCRGWAPRTRGQPRAARHATTSRPCRSCAVRPGSDHRSPRRTRPSPFDAQVHSGIMLSQASLKVEPVPRDVLSSPGGAHLPLDPSRNSPMTWLGPSVPTAVSRRRISAPVLRKLVPSLFIKLDLQLLDTINGTCFNLILGWCAPLSLTPAPSHFGPQARCQIRAWGSAFRKAEDS